MKYHYLFAFVCLCLIGCSSVPKDTGPKAQTFVNIPMTVAGTAIPGDSQEKYLINPRIRSYAVGRLVNKDGTMHEQHSVYRVIADPEWNLTPQPNASPSALAQKQYEQRYALAMLGQINRALNEAQNTENNIRKALSVNALSKVGQEKRKNEITQLRKRQKIIADNLKSLSEFFKMMNDKIDTMSDKIDAKTIRPGRSWRKK